jgi:hypothetical protein
LSNRLLLVQVATTTGPLPLRARVATGGGIEVGLAGYVRHAGRRKQKAASGNA